MARAVALMARWPRCARACRLCVALLGCTGVTACESPEASRVRGGGPGANIYPHPADVRMHEGSQPFWETPVLIPVEHPALTPAVHAAERSRP